MSQPNVLTVQLQHEVGVVRNLLYSCVCVCLCPDSGNQQEKILLGFFFPHLIWLFPFLPCKANFERRATSRANSLSENKCKNTQDALPICAELRKEKLQLWRCNKLCDVALRVPSQFLWLPSEWFFPISSKVSKQKLFNVTILSIEISFWSDPKFLSFR